MLFLFLLKYILSYILCCFYFLLFFCYIHKYIYIYLLLCSFTLYIYIYINCSISTDIITQELSNAKFNDINHE